MSSIAGGFIDFGKFDEEAKTDWHCFVVQFFVYFKILLAQKSAISNKEIDRTSNPL